MPVPPHPTSLTLGRPLPNGRGASRRRSQWPTSALAHRSGRHARNAGKGRAAGPIARWLDALDETGRWALLKLVTGALRVGVSARLAKTALAALGGREPDEIEILWPALTPPYVDLFAWVEGRTDKPLVADPAPFRPPMLSHAIEASDFAKLDPAEYLAEWKWDGVRVQAVAGVRPDGRRVARLYSRTGEEFRPPFPISSRPSLSTARSTANS